MRRDGFTLTADKEGGKTQCGSSCIICNIRNVHILNFITKYVGVKCAILSDPDSYNRLPLPSNVCSVCMCAVRVEVCVRKTELFLL